MKVFTITDTEMEKLNTWLNEQDALAIENQKETIKEDDPSYQWYRSCWDEGYPYTGAIGGGLTYSFSPTSIGMVVKVHYALTGATVDLTDYDLW